MMAFLHRFWFGHSDDLTSQSTESEFMFMAIFWISAVSFVVLMALMGAFVMKYRKRPGNMYSKPSPTHHNLLEITWTVLPSLILVWLFFRGFWGYMGHVVSEAGAIPLQVTAKKWDWSIEYPNGATSLKFEAYDGEGTKEVPVFFLPENSPVELRMISQDVIHSFWVPDYRLKFDVMPNRYTSMAFRTEELPRGVASQDHYVFCAEYCGDRHSDMAAIIRVVRADAYGEFLDTGGLDIDKLYPWEKGAVYAKKYGCLGCHSIDGANNTGPTWLNAYGTKRDFADGSSIPKADDNYIRESILVPSAKIVKGRANQMTPFQGIVSEQEISDLISYMKFLSPDTYDAHDELNPAAWDAKYGKPGDGGSETEDGATDASGGA
ncbi:MAG: c-type cytochrome [Phycisphaerales bacterium]|nr:c-type cytochrome [Phycisphaerales bacterium]